MFVPGQSLIRHCQYLCHDDAAVSSHCLHTWVHGHCQASKGANAWPPAVAAIGICTAALLRSSDLAAGCARPLLGQGLQCKAQLRPQQVARHTLFWRLGNSPRDAGWGSAPFAHVRNIIFGDQPSGLFVEGKSNTALVIGSAGSGARLLLRQLPLVKVLFLS